MNILVVHETEYIEKVVFEYQIIPEIWASRGHNVYVIDYPMKQNNMGWFGLGSLRSSALPNVQRANKKHGVTLIRPGVIQIPIVKRVSAFIAYFFLIPRVIKQYKIEKIFLYSAPTNGLQTVYWARIFGIPTHFRLLDVLHRLVPFKILIWPTFLFEKLVYKKVDEITAITPKLTKYAIELGASPKTTSYLPTGSDDNQFYPQEKNASLVAKYKIEQDDLVILFAGTLYNFSGLNHLIKYLAIHIQSYGHIKLLIVGNGEQGDELARLIKINDLFNNVIITGFINYSELAKYINLADVCINPFDINKITNIIFPSKIYQYLACEKPVIATRLAGLVDLFPENGGSHNIFYFDLNKPKEFFILTDRIKYKRIKDQNPSLQKIASILERKLEKLTAKTFSL